MSGVSVQSRSRTSEPNVYRPGRPATTLLHRIVRENLREFFGIDTASIIKAALRAMD